MADTADLIVIGGGLAGLSLALRLAKSGFGGRVVILEPRDHYADDRSWAFWTPRGSAWSACAARTWDRWSFSRSDHASISQSADGWCYAYLRGLDFYQAALRAIDAHPGITRVAGCHAGQVQAVAGRVTVATTRGTFSARYAVDTRPPPIGQWSGATLFQCFAGRELQLQRPGFDEHAVELMTDMRCDERGFVFSYVLPLSTTRALVEVTRFSPHPLAAAELAPDLDALLESRGWAQGQVLRREAAVLPMGLPPADGAGAAAGVVRAGVGAGALRAASGYGFLRIQAWADACASALMQGRAPVGHPAEPALRRWMDQVFLQALANHPERTPEFFLGMAESVPGTAFVRFMSDQATWTDPARIIAALPPGPFLQALRARRPAARMRA